MRTVERRAARVLVVDDDGRTLLFCGGDPGRPELDPWWYTAGGGVDDGETVEDAARRELLEEVGVTVGDLGPVVRRDDVEFEFDGTLVQQRQTFYLVRVGAASVDESGWTELERRTVVEYRWWSADEIRASHETIYPENLADLLDAHTRD